MLCLKQNFCLRIELNRHQKMYAAAYLEYQIELLEIIVLAKTPKIDR